MTEIVEPEVTKTRKFTHHPPGLLQVHEVTAIALTADHEGISTGAR
jgi:hypothetical protein